MTILTSTCVFSVIEEPSVFKEVPYIYLDHVGSSVWQTGHLVHPFRWSDKDQSTNSIQDSLGMNGLENSVGPSLPGEQLTDVCQPHRVLETKGGWLPCC